VDPGKLQYIITGTRLAAFIGGGKIQNGVVPLDEIILIAMDGIHMRDERERPHR